MSEKVETKKTHRKDETKVSIHFPGEKPIETTAAKMAEAVAKIKERGAGDNSGDPNISPQEVSSARVKSFVKRIEKIEEDQKGLSDDKASVYAEAKATGFDVKTIRKIVALRKIKVEDRREQEELLELYKAALGMEV